MSKINSGEYSDGLRELINQTVSNCINGQDFDWDDCEKFLNLSFEYLVNEINISSRYTKDRDVEELTIVNTICDIEDNVYDGKGETLSFSDLILTRLKLIQEYGDPIDVQIACIKSSIAKSLAIVDAWVASQPAEKETDDE